MHMHIAKWVGALELFPEQDDVHVFHDVWLDAILCDDSLAFTPVSPAPNQRDDGHIRLTYKARDYDGLRPRYFRFSRPALLVELSPWPDFGPHSVELTVDPDGTMWWPLPAPHELPWPPIGPRSRRAQQDRVCTCLPLRLRSAVAAGVDPREVVRTTPRWAKSALVAPEWKTLVEGALEDV